MYCSDTEYIQLIARLRITPRRTTARVSRRRQDGGGHSPPPTLWICHGHVSRSLGGRFVRTAPPVLFRDAQSPPPASLEISSPSHPQSLITAPIWRKIEARGSDSQLLSHFSASKTPDDYAEIVWDALPLRQ